MLTKRQFLYLLIVDFTGVTQITYDVTYDV